MEVDGSHVRSVAALPLLSLFGLKLGLGNRSLQLFLFGVAVVVLLWGFERYRTNFSKVEFAVAILISIGVLVIGVAPDIFEVVGSILRLEQQSLVVTLLANTVFAFLLLYVLALIRGNQVSITDLTRKLTIQQADEEGFDESTVHVVIPAYNEADTVKSVVESLPESVHGDRVVPVVVSDGSSDRTRRVAAEAASVTVEHPINQGQGGALKTGFELAQRQGADIVVTMDADGQHPADELEDIVRPIVDDEADYVLGSRREGTDDSQNSIVRRSGIRAFTWIINVISKADITDCTNGYRAIRGSRIGELTLTEERFSAPELIIEARKNGLRIREVPVTIRPRETGETKKPQLGYALGLARTIFVTWIR